MGSPRVRLGPAMGSSRVCISTCWRCSRSEFDWRYEDELELRYRCSVCQPTEKEVIAFCRLFPIFQSCEQEVGGRVLWFLRVPPPVRRQRRNTFKYFLLGAPWTTCRLYSNHLEFERQFRIALRWRRAQYRTSCVIDCGTDLYDLIIAFLV